MSQLYNNDCLEILKTLETESIDCVIADLPYEVTDCSWDNIIPFEPMWAELNRITKEKSAMVFTSTQPFTTKLIHSNISNFRFEWIWEKPNGTNPFNIAHAPLKCHESIIVFGKKAVNYYPQMTKGKPYKGFSSNEKKVGEVYGDSLKSKHKDNPTGERHPRSVVQFKSENGLHPTQKPVDLMKYLVETYSKEGEVVLDFTMGSGTTGVAAIQTGRQFIGIEKDLEIFNTAKTRIGKAENGLRRFIK